MTLVYKKNQARGYEASEICCSSQSMTCYSIAQGQEKLETTAVVH